MTTPVIASSPKINFVFGLLDKADTKVNGTVNPPLIREAQFFGKRVEKILRRWAVNVWHQSSAPSQALPLGKQSPAKRPADVPSQPESLRA